MGHKFVLEETGSSSFNFPSKSQVAKEMDTSESTFLNGLKHLS
jgi:hypothetical protein